MEEFQEEELVRALSNGDEKVFKYVFDQYYRSLTLFAVKYVGDVEESREIVQEFFIRLWSKRGELKIHFSLKMYLFQGVKNACLNYIESTRTLRRRLQMYQPARVSTDNALENIMVAEQEALLMEAIERLPEKCRRIFWMSRKEKMSNREIAEKLLISIKTVEAQMSIALKRLRDILISLCAFLMC